MKNRANITEMMRRAYNSYSVVVRLLALGTAGGMSSSRKQVNGKLNIFYKLSAFVHDKGFSLLPSKTGECKAILDTEEIRRGGAVSEECISEEYKRASCLLDYISELFNLNGLRCRLHAFFISIYEYYRTLCGMLIYGYDSAVVMIYRLCRYFCGIYTASPIDIRHYRCHSIARKKGLSVRRAGHSYGEINVPINAYRCFA